MGLGVGTLVALLSGMLLTGDWGGLLLNVGAELAGALATYGLLELVIRRREESEAKKADLIVQMGSQVQDVAIAAAEELKRHKWLYDGSLQGANLRGANLQEADLYGVNLQEARLFVANLQGADLANANLQEASLGGANLQEARLTSAHLQGANLQGANLQEADLDWANLQEARLASAHLQGAKLCRTRLRGASLAEANLQGANFDVNTTLPDGTKWTPDTDIARFTDLEHPDFWRPEKLP